MLKKLSVKVKAPPKHFFRCTVGKYGDVYIKLYKRFKNSDRKIGQVRLVDQGGKKFATHSNLDYRYHNKGLGTLMYAKAIEWCLARGYKCQSSGYSSEDAKRVWTGKSIRKYFRITQKQTESGVWANPDYQTWFAYEKKALPKNGKRLTRSQNKRR